VDQTLKSYAWKTVSCDKKELRILTSMEEAGWPESSYYMCVRGNSVQQGAPRPFCGVPHSIVSC
jgi:hypothetical protein